MNPTNEENTARFTDIDKNPIIKKLLMSTVQKPTCHKCNCKINKIGIHISPAGLKYMVFCHGQVQASALPLEMLKDAATKGITLQITDAFVPGEELEIFSEKVIDKMLTPPRKLLKGKRKTKLKKQKVLPVPRYKLLEYKGEDHGRRGEQVHRPDERQALAGKD